MMTLNYKVHEQTLTALPTTSVPRDKTLNYIKLHFDIDDTWDLFKQTGGTITVYCQGYITTDSVTTLNSSPTIISEATNWEMTLQSAYANLESFTIMVVGVYVASDNSTTTNCPTNCLSVTLGKAGTAFTLEPASPTSPAYAQLLAQVYAETRPTAKTWDTTTYPDLPSFLHTISTEGYYSFTNGTDINYRYNLIKSTAGNDTEWYGLLRTYGAAEDNFELEVYSGSSYSTVALLTEFYSKPDGGIPKTDLAAAVQTSLGKADTALQAHQDISGKQDVSNLVTALSSSSTDTQYPSAKCVYDLVGTVEATLNAIRGVS